MRSDLDYSDTSYVIVSSFLLYKMFLSSTTSGWRHP